MKEFKILESMERENSTNMKLKLLEQQMTPDLENYFRLTFGEVILNVASKSIENAMSIKTPLKHKDIGERIKWWMENNNQQSSLMAFSGVGEIKKIVSFSDFNKFFNELKEIRGTEALTRMKEFFNDCSPVEAKWYSRCLIKDLSCGLSWTSINKVFKILGKEEIKVFEVSLCSLIDCTTEENIRKELDILIGEHKELWLEPKYDGIRLIVRRKKGKITCFSRNGKIIETVGFLHSEIEKIFPNFNIELDGELVAKDFQSLMTTIQRKNDLNITMARQFKIFDITTFQGDITYMPYEERREIIEKIIDSEIIQVVKNKKVTTTDEAIEMFNKSVDAGYEGIIVKTNKPYTRDRDNWWKMKPVLTADLEIVALHQGTGRHAGKIACFGVQDASGKVRSNVGSGISDEIISLIAKSKDKAEWLGKIVEVRYDMLTKPDKDGIRKLRFPRFVCFRFDKNKAEVL